MTQLISKKKFRTPKYALVSFDAIPLLMVFQPIILSNHVTYRCNCPLLVAPKEKQREEQANLKHIELTGVKANPLPFKIKFIAKLERNTKYFLKQ